MARRSDGFLDKKPRTKKEKKSKSLTPEQVDSVREEYKEIPKDEDVRVGQYDDETRYKNYRIRRYDYNDVPVIEFSNLEGTWMTRIPYDSEVYQIANTLIDEKIQNDVADLYLTNLQAVSQNANGYFHQAVLMLSVAHVYPRLLSDTLFPDREQRHYRHDWKRLKKMWYDWCRQRDEMLSSREVDPMEDYYLHRSENILSGDDPETDEMMSDVERKRQLMDEIGIMAEKLKPTEEKPVGNFVDMEEIP